MKQNRVKLLLIIGCLFMAFSFTNVRAYVEEPEDVTKYEVPSDEPLIKDTSNKDAECNGYLGNPEKVGDTAYYIQIALNVMKYTSIILLILLSTFDYIKAIVSQDSDAFKKSNVTFVKRLVYCIIIFFAPYLVKLLMGFFGAYGTCNIS